MNQTKNASSERITLAHGNGGRFMRELIENYFVKYLHNSELDVALDAAPISPPAGELMMTTDGFTVKPLEFPGGNIGSLAIHGTVNDLAVSGATPLYLTLNAFIEEGLKFSTLERLIKSMAEAATEANVKIVAGDTKIVPRGEGSGVYFATTGIGVRSGENRLSLKQIQAGDHLIVSGPVGDHGAAVMLAREEFGLRGDLKSDSAAVYPLTQIALSFSGLRFMRDPTRGGLASVCHELVRATQMDISLKELKIPVNDAVSSVCEILGYDPLYLACEGRIVAVVSPEESELLLQQWRQHPQGTQAEIIGQFVKNEGAVRVIIETELGGERIVHELEDEPLPRIC
ncbi:MAG: hydrogenase expression/formation protein HypE [Gammaproteobacteria bacterium]|nr:hydrogenase expression/formation protein HypE [Gammaproteobacteria bacterium]